MLDVGEQITISIDILQDGVVTSDLNFNVDILDNGGNVLDRKVVTILNVDGKYCVLGKHVPEMYTPLNPTFI